MEREAYTGNCKLTVDGVPLDSITCLQKLPNLKLKRLRSERKLRGGNNPYIHFSPKGEYETKSCRSRLSRQRIQNFGFATIIMAIIVVMNNPRVFRHLLRCNTARTITYACNGDCLVKLNNKNYLYPKLKPYSALKLMYEFLNSVVDPFELEVRIEFKDSNGRNYVMTNKIQ